jgi:hypothetical protein
MSPPPPPPPPPATPVITQQDLADLNNLIARINSEQKGK